LNSEFTNRPSNCDWRIWISAEIVFRGQKNIHFRNHWS